jgi:hypothetical protein
VALQVCIKIDHHIAAHNHMKLIKGAISHQIMLSKNHSIKQGCIQISRFTIGCIVFRKGFFSACHNVVLCIELHFLQRDYSALCFFKHLFIDVCGINLRSLSQPLFFHQNRHGVSFFPSRTACMPNSDLRQFSEHRDNLIPESLKKRRVPEHFCHID